MHKNITRTTGFKLTPGVQLLRNPGKSTTIDLMDFCLGFLNFTSTNMQHLRTKALQGEDIDYQYSIIIENPT